ncbi:DUF4190 domain-containing protein [Actinomycetes bacterium KLBMP 9797]
MDLSTPPSESERTVDHPVAPPSSPAAPLLPTLRGRIVKVRSRATRAGHHVAEMGRAGLAQAGERARRKLDERATAQGSSVTVQPDPPSAHDSWVLPAGEPVRFSAAPDQRNAEVVSTSSSPVAPVTPATPGEVVPYAPVQSAVFNQPSYPTRFVAAPLPTRHPAPVVARPRRRRWSMNGAVIAALIVAVVFPPAGLGLAKTARRECREDGRAGGGTALVAHVIAAAGTCVMVLVTLTLFAVFAYGVVQVGSGLTAIGDFLGRIGELFG